MTEIRDALTAQFPLESFNSIRSMGQSLSEILLTFSAVARKADVTRRTLYKWQRTGRFNVQPHPNTEPLRWHVDDINEWLKPQRAAAQPSDAIGG